MRAISSTLPGAPVDVETAAWPPADAGRKRRRAADSSSSRSSRGRSGPPDGRAADRRWRRGRARSARRLAMRVEKQVDKQLLDRRAVVDRPCDSAVGRSRRHAPAGSASTCPQPARRLALALELAGQHRQNRIVAKSIVIVQVLIAERQAEDALRDQRLERVLTTSGLRRRRNKPQAVEPDRALSAAPSSNAPASEVIAPPSKSATTGRPSALPNTLGLRYTPSASGAPFRIGLTRSRKTSFA